MSKTYRAEYEPQTVYGEAGVWWRLYASDRLVAEGWTRGKRHDAEADVRETIRNRDALFAAATGLAS